MASARELLEQADALMRRNRAGVIDTEIPELRQVISMVALAPVPAPAQAPTPVPAPIAPTVLDDVPELTEAVEEIEISSIVELPEDIDESSGWLHHDHGELKVVTTGPDSMMGRPPIAPAVSVAAVATPAPAPDAPASDAAAAPVVSPAAANPATADEWARWEVLADEIRMQVLQRIDLFTEARLKDELSAQLQPIVQRAGAEMVATINERVGGLIRAYIAEAIEREIEKWRGAPH
jgi:hypothetical protein